MWRHAWIVVLIVAAISLVGALVVAQDDRPTVVLVGASNDPIVSRMRDELQILGIEVIDEAVMSDLRSVATKHRAAAAATASPTQVNIWVAADVDRGIEEGTLQLMDDNPEQLALRAVELLRGRLLPVPPETTPTAVQPPPAAPPPAPPAPPPAPSQPTPEPAPQPRALTPAPAPPPLLPAPATPTSIDRTPDTHADEEARPATLGAGLGAALSPGGVTPTMQVSISAAYRIFWRLHIDAHVSIPTLPASIEEPEGHIVTRTLIFGGGGSLSLTSTDEPLAIRAGAGFSAIALLYSASPEAPFQASSGTSWNVVPYARLHGSYAFVPWLAVAADAIGGVTIREHIIRAAGREVASFGRPLVLGSLGLELRL